MKRPEMKQEMLCIRGKAVMNSFCYDFCKVLLEKLKELDGTHCIFENDEFARKNPKSNYKVKALVSGIIGHLIKQTKIDHSISAHCTSITELSAFIADVTMFLQIFHVQEK